jgi:ADP-glucose pyrophosphorylase
LSRNAQRRQHHGDIPDIAKNGTAIAHPFASRTANRLEENLLADVGMVDAFWQAVD